MYPRFKTENIAVNNKRLMNSTTIRFISESRPNIELFIMHTF